MNPFIASTLVGIGGFAGSVARYGVTIFSQRFSIEWPIGTMMANIIGCLIIGFVSALSDRAEVLSPAARLLLATGFCGGFTTMSSMVYETAQMFRSGDYLHASFYVCASLLGSMLAFIVGVVSVRLLVKGTGDLWN